jgi:hypothetical protein
VAVLLSCTLCSCEKAAPPGLTGPSALEVYLTDSPAGYKGLWINIQKLMVHVSRDTVSDNGWITLPLARPGKYNLLGLDQGHDTLLASARLPSGAITRLRLMLGDGNTLVLAGGEKVPLHIPSSLQDGIDISLSAMLTTKTSLALVLDIDARRSVKKTDDGKGYVLDPVIRPYPRGTAGCVGGVVLPPESGVKVLAVRGADTVTTLAGPGGTYSLCGLLQGAYSLIFSPSSESGLQGDTLFHVTVGPATSLTVDTVWLRPLQDSASYPVPLSSGLQLPL